jgi:3-isopropylmalate/(R)-2-methylmalate dehydratase small subunit
MSEWVQGRVWCFGDDIDTDLIQPMHAMLGPLERQPRHVFEANRPGWVDEVAPGDVIVAGTNFGTGSSRPAAQVLVLLGIGGVLAESINGLFFRNCVNYGLPALECPGVGDLFSEGEQARFDLVGGRVENVSSGRMLAGRGWPAELLPTLRAGGVLQQLRAEGLLVETEEEQP